MTKFEAKMIREAREAMDAEVSVELAKCMAKLCLMPVGQFREYMPKLSDAEVELILHGAAQAFCERVVRGDPCAS